MMFSDGGATGLTWDIIAKAVGVGGPSKFIRKQAKSGF